MLASPLDYAPLAQHAVILYRIALALLGLALAISVVTDLRSRLIYNVITLPALALELLLVWLSAGLVTVGDAGVGVLICAGPFALSAIFGAMGMGDVKLMAVVGVVAGAAGGWTGALKVLTYIAVAGGVQVAVQWIFAALRKTERPKYIPYGVAIAAGTLVAWVTN